MSTDVETLLKINISWQHWYPGCSTTPWQLEGVILGLQNMGHRDSGLIAAHNGTVVVDSFEGEVNNKHKPVQDKYGLRTVHLDTPPEPWVRYEPKAEMMALHDIYPEGIEIPACFAGKNIVHLPTMKTHVFTTMTGAMKNAFGGLAAPQAALDAFGDSRDFGGSAGDSAGDSPGDLRGYGRDVRRRRAGSPGDAVAHQEPDRCRSRPGGGGRRGGVDDGVSIRCR